jgi:hypothetical protein
MAEDWNAVPEQYRDDIVDADEIFNRNDEELGLGKLPKKKGKKQIGDSWNNENPSPVVCAPVKANDSWDFGGTPK